MKACIAFYGTEDQIKGILGDGIRYIITHKWILGYDLKDNISENVIDECVSTLYHLIRKYVFCAIPLYVQPLLIVAQQKNKIELYKILRRTEKEHFLYYDNKITFDVDIEKLLIKIFGCDKTLYDESILSELFKNIESLELFCKYIKHTLTPNIVVMDLDFANKENKMKFLLDKLDPLPF